MSSSNTYSVLYRLDVCITHNILRSLATLRGFWSLFWLWFGHSNVVYPDLGSAELVHVIVVKDHMLGSVLNEVIERTVASVDVVAPGHLKHFVVVNELEKELLVSVGCVDFLDELDSDRGSKLRVFGVTEGVPVAEEPEEV